MKSVRGRDPESGEYVEVLIKEDGRIGSIVSAQLDDENLWLSPGLIDLQVNGYAGCDLNAGGVTPDLVTELTHKLLAVGVTTYAPTLVTASEESIVAALRAIAEARRNSALVRHAIPYAHVEGPHISPTDGPRGAHPREHVRPPDVAEFERWQAASEDLVGMVTISPHWDGALEYIAALAKKNILVSVGHSDAEPGRIHAAVQAGARLSTHLGNGVAGQLPRHPNLIWAQLADDCLTAGFIADGHHLPPDTLKAMLRAKGEERSFLVSDTVALGGMPPGVYEAAVGGKVELTADGRIGILGTRILAGAALPLKDGVANVARLPTFSLRTAFRMATRNPGRFVGGRGVLEVGAFADLMRFRWDVKDGIKIERVLLHGMEQNPTLSGGLQR